MSQWLFEKEDYHPVSNNIAYVDKSINSLLKILSKIKYINTGLKKKSYYFVNPFIKFIFTLVLVIMITYTRNFYSLAYVFGVVVFLLLNIHKNDIFNVIKALSENVSALERHHLEYRIKRKDGSYLWIYDQGLFIFNNQKNLIENLINRLKNNPNFIRGKNGTILSIGCYSECWDTNNKLDTIKLINDLLEFNNPIQLSTKRRITKKDLELINLSKIKYKGQLSIYISNSSITMYKEYEDKTTKPSIRFKSFDLINEFPLI